jgi:hypothetical protein
MFAGLVFGGGYFGQGPPGTASLVVPPRLGHPPIRVRNVTSGRPTVDPTAGTGSVRFSSGAPTVRNTEGSE